MALDDETLQILGKAASLAGSYGLKKQAAEITAALREVSPDDEDMKFLHAATCFQAQDTGKAKAILLDEILAKNPDNSSAKALLGVIYEVEGKTAERDHVLKEVIAAGEAAGEEATAIANELLNS